MYTKNTSKLLKTPAKSLYADEQCPERISPYWHVLANSNIMGSRNTIISLFMCNTYLIIQRLFVFNEASTIYNFCHELWTATWYFIICAVYIRQAFTQHNNTETCQLHNPVIVSNNIITIRVMIHSRNGFQCICQHQSPSYDFKIKCFTLWDKTFTISVHIWCVLVISVPSEISVIKICINLVYWVKNITSCNFCNYVIRLQVVILEFSVIHYRNWQLILIFQFAESQLCFKY